MRDNCRAGILPATSSDAPFVTVPLRQLHSEPPLVFVLAGADDSNPAAARIRNVSSGGFEILQVEPEGSDGIQDSFQLALSRSESGAGEVTQAETIAYLAIEAVASTELTSTNGSPISFETLLSNEAIRGWDNVWAPAEQRGHKGLGQWLQESGLRRQLQ